MPCAGISRDPEKCDGRRMTDDRRPRSLRFAWLFLGVGALFALRFAVHAASRLLDLVSTVLVLGALAFVGWKVAVGGRRDRHRD